MTTLFEVKLPDSIPVHLFPAGKGITIDEKEKSVRFEGAHFSEKKVRELVERIAERITDDGFIAPIKAIRAKSVSSQEAEAIATATGADFSDYVLFSAYACNTKIDRSQDRFTKSFLERLAKIVNEGDKPAFLYAHLRNQTIGKVLTAKVIPMVDEPGQHVLQITFSVNKKAIIPGQPDLKIAGMLTNGGLEFVSISFAARGEIEEFGDTLIRIFKGEEGEMVLFTETSVVYYPAQIGAKLKGFELKEVSILPPPKAKSKVNIEKSIPIKVGNTEYQFGVKAAGEGDAVTLTLTAPDALAKAIEQKDQEITDLKKSIEDLKKPYTDSIIKHQTELKKTVMAETLLKGLDLATLKGMETDLVKEFAVANPVIKDAGKATEDKETDNLL